MKTYGGVEVQLHAFLTSALDGGEWSALHPRYPLYRTQSGPWDNLGAVTNRNRLRGPLPIHYTDWANSTERYPKIISKFRYTALTDLGSSCNNDKLRGRILWSLMHGTRMWDHPQSLHVADTHGKFGRNELRTLYVTTIFWDSADPLEPRFRHQGQPKQPARASYFRANVTQR
jgi:hypothetical protein